MKKKALSLLLAGVMCLCLLAGCGGTAATNGVVSVYNWGEYMDTDLFDEFTEQTGIRVNYSTYESNEAMYTKLRSGSVNYDVIIPSDYMISRLIDEGMLMKLDFDQIPNYANIDEQYRNMIYDPNNEYSVPYFWGTVGLVYNQQNVPTELIEEKGYEILKDTNYAGNIYMYDSERDSFMVALKSLGYSMNTQDDAEIEEAYQWLLELNDTMDPAYVTDEVIDSMMNGTKDIAVVYSGDAAVILDENPDMAFTMPKEGTNVWCDAMCIPANAENPKLAHEFINYMLSYDAAYDNTVTVGYASTNDEVLKEVAETEYAGNAAYLPRESYEKDEVFEDNEVMRQKLSQLWLKVKAQ